MLAVKRNEMIDLLDKSHGLSQEDRMRNIASQLGGNYDVSGIEVSMNGREYLMYFYQPVRGGSQTGLPMFPSVGCPSFFEIKTAIPYSHPFFGIRTSDSLDWVAEHVLSMKDFHVGDDDFDAKFYIKVSDIGWEWGGKFFSRDIIRRGISNLLLGGFDQIQSEDGYLKIIKYGDSCPEIETINDAIEQIHQIISNFPEDYSPPISYRLRGYNYWKPLVNFIVILFGLGALVFWYLCKTYLNPAP
jgi:hypothetical protein